MEWKDLAILAGVALNLARLVWDDCDDADAVAADSAYRAGAREASAPSLYPGLPRRINAL